MLVAFQNGKRLNDLPQATGANPYDMTVEVLEGGESKKAELATFLPYMEDEVSYGIEFDTSVSSPTCTRIGNPMLHRVLPVQNRMKGCTLADSGAVNEYLNPADWRGQTRDGSRGQVMVELPMYYRKFEMSGTKLRVRISEYPVPGYHQVRRKYVSAYEATVQRSTNTLASVVNDTADYRGGNNNAAYDGTYRTFLGRSATGISRTNFRNYARKRKAGSTEWNCMTYDIQKDLFWLFSTEYATLNAQLPVNAELTAEGYHQGGLGAGVSTLTYAMWNEYNGHFPFVPCGCTDELGNGSGEIAYNIPDASGGTLKTVMVNRYRGIENPFGHIWEWTDGINVRISPNTDAGGDGLSKVFVTDNPALFNDTNYNGYSYVGNEARVEGFVKRIIFGEFGEIMPTEVGGGSTTYFCDYHYTNIPAVETLRGVLFGGSAINGANCGFGYATSYSAPSITDTYFGSRLCFIPAA